MLKISSMSAGGWMYSAHTTNHQEVIMSNTLTMNEMNRMGPVTEPCGMPNNKEHFKLVKYAERS